jgi:hypothetical protein
MNPPVGQMPPDASLCYGLYRRIFSILNKGMLRIFQLTSFGRLSSCKTKGMVWLITDCAGLVYFSSWLCFNRKYSIGREAHLDSCTHELICTPKTPEIRNWFESFIHELSY